jgi:hypothetical protein
MNQRGRSTIALALFALILLASLVTLVPRVQAETAQKKLPENYSALSIPIYSSLLAQTTPPPPPEQDTCQHCHLSGEITNMWTPFFRWVLFGSMGLVFVYGTYRAGSVMVNRKPWKPLWSRTVDWIDERLDIVEPMGKILKKPVPLFATHWMYCFGGITFLLFIIQCITGVMLAFYYKPTPEDAYASIQFIENEVRFGYAIRAIHHWSANGMVVMVVAHMVRVFITGAYKPPRELNWVNGTFLGILTLAFGLTGYLLPWDQRAYWATTVATEIAGGMPQIGDIALVFMRGGWDVTAITLSRFFAAHVLVLPVAIIVLMGLHFLMIRRQGIARPL